MFRCKRKEIWPLDYLAPDECSPYRVKVNRELNVLRSQTVPTWMKVSACSTWRRTGTGFSNYSQLGKIKAARFSTFELLAEAWDTNGGFQATFD